MSASDFNDTNLGGKSNNLKRLQGKLPEWINLPNSVAIPFGVFERILGQKTNKEVAQRYESLVHRMGKEDGKVRNKLLMEIRKAVMALKAPDDLVSNLHEVANNAGLTWPTNWEGSWHCIKHVWASKWNERAYLSRRTRDISHEALFMAVLIQEVVEAEYSFVIHTVNPFTGNMDEIYAEVVPGLGETLVGNHPGKALSFTCPKGQDKSRLLSFASKSVGLFGKGLIFRSDSNGEDLAEYAGAGLYDSIMLEQPQEVSLDYTEDVLVQDKYFRKDFLVTVAATGIIIEAVFGSAQDIEGAYSKGQYYVVQTRPQVGVSSE